MITATALMGCCLICLAASHVVAAIKKGEPPPSRSRLPAAFDRDLLDTHFLQFSPDRIHIDAAATIRYATNFKMETNNKMSEAPPSPGDSTCSTNYTLLVSLSTIENATNEEIRNHKIDNVEKIMRLEKERMKPGADHEAIDAELKQCRMKSEEIDKEWLERGVFHALFAPKIAGVCGSLDLESSVFHEDDLSAMTSVDDDEDSSILNQALQIVKQKKDEGKKNKGLRTLSSSEINRKKMTR